MGAGKGASRPGREQSAWRVKGRAGQTKGTGWVKDTKQANLREQSELRAEVGQSMRIEWQWADPL